MQKSPNSLFTILFLSALLYWIWFSMMPRNVSTAESPTAFSNTRAMGHIQKIASTPHYTGSPGHKQVSAYILQQLQALGLQPQIQQGFTITEKGVLAYSENILVRIQGNVGSKALLLLSHYDSAPHTKSKGAADNAAGVATILEGLRVYLQTHPTHRNDIIVLFSDTEEVGLNGAALFVGKHPWAKDVGLVLNFEARGTAGPSYMLMEVNNGNAAMIKGFSDASPRYPVANSLMYSIYKMLPNDTDLTVFRETGMIQGFNFAFIDDHFNYHTVQDDIQHLDQRSLAHQGSYLMPLLTHFAEADLAGLNTDTDFVYFNSPLSMVSYPFGWVLPMACIALVLFLGLLVIGFAKKILQIRIIARGFLIYFGCLLIVPATAFLGWQLILIVYPSYGDIPQGFTYNGHLYIAAFLVLGLALSFLAYGRKAGIPQVMNYYIAPITSLLILNFIIAFMLPGAGFLVIPLFAALVTFGIFIVTQKHSYIIALLLTIPACIVFFPLITAMPVGLGLKNIFIAVLLLVLMFGLILPVISLLSGKKMWAYAFLITAMAFFSWAHFTSGYEKGRARPNSLVYVADTSTGTAHWASYDHRPDEWTAQMLGQHPAKQNALPNLQLGGKYGSQLRLSAAAPWVSLPAPTIQVYQDTIIGNRQFYSVNILPNRPVNRYDIYLGSALMPEKITANGELLPAHPRGKEPYKKLLQYYVVDNKPLYLKFSLPVGHLPELELLESSFDLSDHPEFLIAPRPAALMPLPFVLNDAVVVRYKIKWSVTDPANLSTTEP